VCNHPDLFEGRPIVSAYDMPGLVAHLPSAALRALEAGPFRRADLAALGLRLELGAGMAAWEAQTVQARPPPTVRVSVACVDTGLLPIQVSWKVSACGAAATYQPHMRPSALRRRRSLAVWQRVHKKASVRE